MFDTCTIIYMKLTNTYILKHSTCSVDCKRIGIRRPQANADITSNTAHLIKHKVKHEKDTYKPKT